MLVKQNQNMKKTSQVVGESREKLYWLNSGPFSSRLHYSLVATVIWWPVNTEIFPAGKRKMTAGSKSFLGSTNL